jgi:hypothetical protein
MLMHTIGIDQKIKEGMEPLADFVGTQDPVKGVRAAETERAVTVGYVLNTHATEPSNSLAETSADAVQDPYSNSIWYMVRRRRNAPYVRGI